MPEPTTLAYLGGALLSGLGSYLGATGAARQQREMAEWQLREQERIAKERAKRAREALAGYGYTPFATQYQPFQMTAYASPLEEQQRSVLAQYLSGQLTPAQERILEQQRRLGEAQIARAAAATGMPGGARGALAVQLARDIGLGAGQLAQQQQQLGLQIAPTYEQMWERRFLMPQEVAREERRYAYEQALADYLRQQQAAMRLKELLAQYA